jgi:hypothetical protein
MQRVMDELGGVAEPAQSGERTHITPETYEEVSFGFMPWASADSGQMVPLSLTVGDED